MKKVLINLKIKKRISAVLSRLNSETSMIVEKKQEAVSIADPKLQRSALLASHLKYSHSLGKKY